MWVKFAAGAGSLALAAFFGWMYGNARFEAGKLQERNAWHVRYEDEQELQHDREIAMVQRGSDALIAQAERYAARAPIVLTSHETVTRYAETAAGRAPCLGSDRVSGIDALDVQLFGPPTTAGVGDKAVPIDAGASSTRR